LSRIAQIFRFPSLPIRILALVAVLALSWFDCKSPTSPGGAGEADILVYNDYGELLDIYLDGKFMFSIPFKHQIEIDNVSLEEHALEACLTSTGALIESKTIEPTEYADYSWTINNPPDINVINNSGLVLKVYLDGSYQFDLVDEENRWMMEVAFGDRFLKAVRASDEQEYASITIRVDENMKYSWTIE
jgi:hypothetical protein